MYHVKAVQYPVPGDLDLNIADEEEFSPDKLRATVERLYMTVFVGILSAVKHISRLRSWRETQRTAYFCTVRSPKPFLQAAIIQFGLTTYPGVLHRVVIRFHCPAYMRHSDCAHCISPFASFPLPTSPDCFGR